MRLSMGLGLPAFFRGAGGGGFLPARDGTLSLNLAFLADYAPAVPTLNILKLAGPWAGDVTGELSSGDMDANGYPTAIPSGDSLVQCGLVWNGTDYTALKNRNIVFVWTGTASITIDGNVSIVSTAANRVVFQSTGNIWRVEVSAIGTGISNAYAVFEEYESDLLAGELWNPEWLRLMSRDYTLGNPRQIRDLRFMDWMGTNASNVVNYSDHPSLNSFRWWGGLSNNVNPNGRGVPIMALINLCNKIRANLWFCIPISATDDYIEAFAADIRDNLSTSLKCILELSNETWNTSQFFPQGFTAASRGIADWTTQKTGTISVSGGTVTGTGTAFESEVSVDDYLAGPDGAYYGRVSAIADDENMTVIQGIGLTATGVDFWTSPSFPNNDWTVKRSVQLAYLFDAELGDTSRRWHTLGTHYALESVSEVRLAAQGWLDAEGEATGGDPFTGWVDPSTVFDFLAAGIYYGNSAISDSDWEDIAARYDVDPDDGALAVAEAVDADVGATAISEAANSMKRQSDVAKAAGLGLITYESGQHLTVPGAATAPEAASITDAIRLYFTTPAAAAHLATWGDAIKAWTDGPLCWFNLDGDDSDEFGTWGLFPRLDFAGDRKTAFVNTLAQSAPWFGDENPPIFLGTLPEITGTEGQNISSSPVNMRNLFSANFGEATLTGLSGVSLTAAGTLSGAPTLNGTGSYTVTLTNPAGSVAATGAYDIAVAPALPTPEMVTFNGSTDISSTALTGRRNTDRISSYFKFQRTSTANGYIIGTSGGTSPFDLMMQNGNFRLRLYSSGNSNFYNVSSIGSGLSDGNPHEVFWSYNGTTGAIVIVIDGSTVVNTTTSIATLRGASWAPTIGAVATNGSQDFNGDMERVTVWDDVALDVTDSAVRTSMATPASAGSLGTNIIDFFGPPATWNAGTNSGPGGTFDTITGAVT